MTQSPAESPLLTIVLPAWNREASLPSVLGSIARSAQSVASLVKIIIVDNNSTDNTRVVAEQFCNDATISARLIDCPRQGATCARNDGLDLVDTPWTLFFDSDDIMLLEMLPDLLAAIKNHPETDIISWDIDCQLISGKRARRHGLKRLSLGDHIIYSSLSTQRMAAKTDLFRKAGKWDERCPAWNDYELGVRLLLNADSLLYINKIFVKTFISRNSLTESRFSRSPAKWETSLDIIDARLVNLNINTDLVNARRAILAGRYSREGAADEAKRLLSKAVANRKAVRRIKFLYGWTKIVGRATAPLSRLLFL